MNKRTIIAMATVCGLMFGSSVSGQEKKEQKSENKAEVIIINQDGERVDPGELKQRIIRTGDGSGFTFQAKDGKITIVDKDGKKQEIDIAGAKSITIQQSTTSENKDGEQSTVTKGKAVIIGPDGKRHEIELDGPLALGDASKLLMFKDGLPKDFAGRLRMLPRPMAKLEGLPGAIRALPANVGKYMIGVNCGDVPESLRAHLDLDEGVGILVESVSDDSPAAKAGMKRHDILISADDNEIGEVKDLVDAVQKAGEAEKKLSVTAVRSGKVVTVKVQPTQRPAGQLGMRMLGKPLDLEFQEFGPGMILDPGFGGAKDLEFQMKAMQKQMQQMQEMQKMMEKVMKDRDFKFEFKQDSDKDSDKDSDQDSDRSGDRT